MDPREALGEELFEKVAQFVLHEVTRRFAAAAEDLGVEVKGVQIRPSATGRPAIDMVFHTSRWTFGTDLRRTVDEIFLKDLDQPALGLDEGIIEPAYLMGKLDHVVKSRSVLLQACAQATDEDDLHRRIAELSGQFAALRKGTIEEGKFKVEHAWEDGIPVGDTHSGTPRG